MGKNHIATTKLCKFEVKNHKNILFYAANYRKNPPAAGHEKSHTRYS